MNNVFFGPVKKQKPRRIYYMESKGYRIDGQRLARHWYTKFCLSSYLPAL